jgi:hypothetical protein
MKKELVIVAIIIIWLVIGFVGLKMNWLKKEEKEPAENNFPIEKPDQQTEVGNILGWEKGNWWEVQISQYSAFLPQPEWMPGPKLKFEVKDVKENQGQKKAEIFITYSDKENQPELTGEDFTKVIYNLDNFQILGIYAKVHGEDLQFTGSNIKFAPYYSLCPLPQKPTQEGEATTFKLTQGKLKDQLLPARKISIDNSFQLWYENLPWWVYYEDENTKAELINWQS